MLREANYRDVVVLGCLWFVGISCGWGIEHEHRCAEHEQDRRGFVGRGAVALFAGPQEPQNIEQELPMSKWDDRGSRQDERYAAGHAPTYRA